MRLHVTQYLRPSCSASPPGAKATGPRSAAWSTAARPASPITAEEIQVFLDKRKPGQSRFTTQRKEPDEVEILSGVFPDDDGQQVTTGAPIALIIRNVDQRTKDYGEIKDTFRPGHADFTYWAKYGIRDYRGGGRSSARETAMRVAAGAIARKVLARHHDPRRAGPDRRPQGRPLAVGLGRGRLPTRSSARIPARCPSGRTISTACARRAPRSAP